MDTLIPPVEKEEYLSLPKSAWFSELGQEILDELSAQKAWSKLLHRALILVVLTAEQEGKDGILIDRNLYDLADKEKRALFFEQDIISLAHLK